MDLQDLSKDIQRLLLQHWTKGEIDLRLGDPEYFVHQVVNPRLDYLRRMGEDVPALRLQRAPNGGFKILLF